jgi:simple sugar transport system ATP-binding protein
MGYYQPDSGQITVAGHEANINRPQEAALAGIGMVYQHFTVIDNMTVLENIVLARPYIPSIVHWKQEAATINQQLENLPFSFDLQRKVSSLSAGEKQKLEITKQLLLKSKILILDEPTSVLTPQEADHVLAELKSMAHEQGLTVLMITHKFREVMSYSDDVTVLRKGEYVGSCSVSETSPTQLSEMMMGEKVTAKPLERIDAKDTTKPSFSVENFGVLNDQGMSAVSDFNLAVNAGEIVGIAGISGNGQTELVAGLSGQRAIHKGELRVGDQAFSPTRKNLQQHSVFVLPEEPLKNACVPQMTVAENMALRNYDLAPLRNGLNMLNFGKLKKQAEEFIEKFNVKTPSTFEPIGNLSGGNVQRAVLARELSNDVNVLIVANPCFGLDFNSVAFIRQKIMEARNSGAAVLLVSEDLDEIMQLSDRFYVMSNGELLLESTPDSANIIDIGHAMAGHTEVEIEGDAYDKAS